MKRVLCFGLTLAMMMTLLMTSALAVDSEDTMEKTTTADKEQKALRLNDVVSTDDYKENIFNSILNSVDYYDADRLSRLCGEKMVNQRLFLTAVTLMLKNLIRKLVLKMKSIRFLLQMEKNIQSMQKRELVRLKMLGMKKFLLG